MVTYSLELPPANNLLRPSNAEYEAIRNGLRAAVQRHVQALLRQAIVISYLSGFSPRVLVRSAQPKAIPKLTSKSMPLSEFNFKNPKHTAPEPSNVACLRLLLIFLVTPEKGQQ